MSTQTAPLVANKARAVPAISGALMLFVGCFPALLFSFFMILSVGDIETGENAGVMDALLSIHRPVVFVSHIGIALWTMMRSRLACQVALGLVTIDGMLSATAMALPILGLPCLAWNVATGVVLAVAMKPHPPSRVADLATRAGTGRETD